MVLGVRGRVWSVLVFALAPVLVVLARLTWGADVPEVLPTHWSSQGNVDGTTSADVFFWGCLVVCGVCALVGAALSLGRNLSAAIHQVGIRALGPLVVAAFIGWLAAVGYARILYAAHGSATAQAVHLPERAAIPIIGAGVVAAVLVSIAVVRSATRS